MNRKLLILMALAATTTTVSLSAQRHSSPLPERWDAMIGQWSSPSGASCSVVTDSNGRVVVNGSGFGIPMHFSLKPGLIGEASVRWANSSMADLGVIGLRDFLDGQRPGFDVMSRNECEWTNVTFFLGHDTLTVMIVRGTDADRLAVSRRIDLRRSTRP